MDSFFVICVSCLAVSAPCRLLSFDLLALFYLMFSYGDVTFPYVVLGQVRYLIVSISDSCLLP